MTTYSAQRAFSILLSDEVWQASLSEASVQAVIARLEDLIPPDAELSEARFNRLRRAVRSLGENVEALNTGQLDETGLVETWLAVFEA
jgi:hypothetical protein